MELRKKKDQSGEEYSWTDYMSLLFTHNVSPFPSLILKVIFLFVDFFFRELSVILSSCLGNKRNS